MVDCLLGYGGMPRPAAARPLLGYGGMLSPGARRYHVILPRHLPTPSPTDVEAADARRRHTSRPEDRSNRCVCTSKPTKIARLDLLWVNMFILVHQTTLVWTSVTGLHDRYLEL